MALVDRQKSFGWFNIRPTMLSIAFIIDWTVLSLKTKLISSITQRYRYFSNTLLFYWFLLKFNPNLYHRNYSYVNIWNSTSITGKEFLRGCKLLARHGRKDFVSSWYSSTCQDYLHPSNIAIAEATQILLNDFCNRYFIWFQVIIKAGFGWFNKKKELFSIEE